MQQPNTHPDLWHHASCWAVMILLALLLAACDDPGSSVHVPEEVSAQHVPEEVLVHRSVPPSLVPGDWSTYLADDAHSGFNGAETTITPKSAVAFARCSAVIAASRSELTTIFPRPIWTRSRKNDKRSAR